nr:hypothetical protein [Tanacetum cinerariifolium]
MKSKNPSRIWYFGSGPEKGAFERLDSQNPSTNHDDHPINKEHGYLQFQDKESVIHEDNVTMENLTWKKQPDLLKEDIISKTTEHSDFKSTCPLLARAIKTQLASHHKTRQYILHKHCLKYPTKEEEMTHPPNGVKVAEWVLLCDRFVSKEFQKISATNKRNRACNEVPPTVGTKSVARRIHMSDLQNEEASTSWTQAEICIEKLGHILGHIRGRSAYTKHVFETESIRMDLNSEKEKTKHLEKDHLELKENHLKLQKELVSLTKK